jgi:hypothetical protein
MGQSVSLAEEKLRLEVLGEEVGKLGFAVEVSMNKGPAEGQAYCADVHNKTIGATFSTARHSTAWHSTEHSWVRAEKQQVRARSA